MAFDKSILQKADCLVYRPQSAFGWVIAFKTWSYFSHVEIYMGDNMSGASRNGLGVNTYLLRTDGISCVLRPRPSLDFEGYRRWHNQVIGQRYDWIALLIFMLAVKQGAQDRMFCSEYAVRAYRAMGCKPFAEHWDADKTPPAMMYASPIFDVVWEG
jgi:hypothetical protein